MKLYALRLTAHLALGNSPAAHSDFRDGLRLATVTDEEPALLFGALRMFVAAFMEQAVWEGIVNHLWTEPELRQIEADLARLDLFKDCLFAIESERVIFNQITDMLAENPRQMDQGFRRKIAVSPFYPTGWFYQSKVRSNRYTDEIVARMDTAQRRYFGDRPLPSDPRNFRPWRERIVHLYASIPPSYESIQRHFVQIATKTDLTRLACAAERYRLAHGAYPAELSAVVPDFLPALPVEIVNGEPYGYSVNDKGGFFLYSAGVNTDGTPLAPKAESWEQASESWRFPSN